MTLNTRAVGIVGVAFEVTRPIRPKPSADITPPIEDCLMGSTNAQDRNRGKCLVQFSMISVEHNKWLGQA